MKRRLKKTVGILVNGVQFKIKFPTAVRYNRFIAQFVEDEFKSDLQASSEDGGLIILNPTLINAIWNYDSELKERKGSKGFYKIRVYLIDNLNFYFLVTGESRSRSCFRCLSGLINQTPDNKVYTLNQEENMSCFFKFDREVIAVTFDEFKTVTNTTKIINGYC